MTLTATLEAIKAYLKKTEKGEIKPDNLPPCRRCHLEARHFKIHAYRERRFLIIVNLFGTSRLLPSGSICLSGV